MRGQVTRTDFLRRTTVSLVGTFGAANPSPHDDVRHRSSLRVTLTSVDGATRTVTLQGVGCSISMCSRVRAKDIKTDDVWLDGLASVRPISHDARGSVKAILELRVAFSICAARSRGGHLNAKDAEFLAKERKGVVHSVALRADLCVLCVEILLARITHLGISRCSK